MVGLWSKEKNACCGKLIMKDFRKMNPRDFKPLYQLTREELERELIIFAPDGKCYVNSKKPGCEFAFSVFETLMRESTSTLEECRKEFLEKYPDMTLESWAEKTNKKRLEEKESIGCFAGLVVPFEQERRRIETTYYGERLLISKYI